MVVRRPFGTAYFVEAGIPREGEALRALRQSVGQDSQVDYLAASAGRQPSFEDGTRLIVRVADHEDKRRFGVKRRQTGKVFQHYGQMLGAVAGHAGEHSSLPAWHVQRDARHSANLPWKAAKRPLRVFVVRLGCRFLSASLMRLSACP